MKIIVTNMVVEIDGVKHTVAQDWTERYTPDSKFYYADLIKELFSDAPQLTVSFSYEEIT